MFKLQNPFIVSFICAVISMILSAINLKASKEKITAGPIIKVGLLVFGMVLLGLTIISSDSQSGGKGFEQEILTGSPDF